MSSDRFLEGRVAVVTGGTRGIGFAVAGALLRSGASVAICGRGRSALDRALGELRSQYGDTAIGKRADVSSEEDVLQLFSEVDRVFGGVDILVNNAGVGIFAPTDRLTPEDFRRTIDTNLTGAFLCSRQALSRFRKRGGGFIVNLSSLAGKNAFAGGAAYNASKWGLNGFSEAMMLDHRYDNVRVSTIMPGSVNTGFGANPPASGEHWKIAPEDVAEIVLAVLRMPARTLISAVEVRPSKPQKR
jgi:3-oxoacyl-[acyl-carrier protein] reductase